MKELYKFNVYVNREVPETDVKQENGETITTTKNVTKSVPIEFIVKEPNRAEKEEAEIVRSTYLANFIRRGVMPEAVLAKIYSDLGGTENEAEKKYYSELTGKLIAKIEEYQNLILNKDENKDKIDACLKDIAELRTEITTFQYQKSSFFENTAEYKAKIKLTEYLFTLLVYWRQDDKSEFKPYFEGGSFDKRLTQLEKFEDAKDEIYAKMKDIALFVISVYIHSGGNIKPDDVGQMVKDSFDAAKK